MMKFVALAVLLTVAAAQDCYPKCAYKFCNLEDSFELTVKDLPFTTAICYKGKPVAPGIATSEAYVGTMPEKLISEAELPGIAPMFSSSFLKGYSGKNYSALSHGEIMGNQLQYLNETCFKVPIASVQVKEGETFVNKNLNDPATDCISVITELPELPVPTPMFPAATGTVAETTPGAEPSP